MTQRREWGSGTLTKAEEGVWRLQINLGQDPLTGKRLRRTETFHGTEAQARARLRKLTAKKPKATASGRTLGDLWAAYLASRELKGMTAFNRGQADAQFKRYVPAHLIASSVERIDTETIDNLYRLLLERKVDDDHTISPATIKRFHTNLRAAFSHGVKLRWIEENPVSRATVPDVDEAEVEPPTPEELATFLAYIDTLERDPGTRGKVSPLPDFVWLLVATGARPAELCALRWSDLDGSTLTIDESVSREKGAPTKPTKTRKVRRIRLDEDTVALLENRRRRWLAVKTKAGIHLHTDWVFPSATDVERPWRPDGISAAFARARDAAGASERVVMRNLRHDAASFLVGSGMDVLAVARRLGHSPQMLLNRYAHVLDANADRAAEAVGARMRGLKRS